MLSDERPPWLASIRERNPELAVDLQTLLDEHSVLGQKASLNTDQRLRDRRRLRGGRSARTDCRRLGKGRMGSAWLAEPLRCTLPWSDQSIAFH